MIDLHIHSQISHDGKASIMENCQKALELGLEEIGFTEHLDLYPSDPHFGLHNYEQYLEEIKEARKKFPKLKIRMAVEVTYLPKIRKEIQEYLSDKEYDYVLGAIHLVRNGDFTISEKEGSKNYFAQNDPEKCYEEYFELTLEMVRSGLFDAVAHLDMLNRYGIEFYPDWKWTKNYGLIRRIYEGMLKRGMALEINTSGLRQSPNRTYPDIELIRFYKELQGEIITIGSDAHNLENIGSGIEQTINMLKHLGFFRLTSFERRQIKWIQIKNL